MANLYRVPWHHEGNWVANYFASKAEATSFIAELKRRKSHGAGEVRHVPSEPEAVTKPTTQEDWVTFIQGLGATE
jgi:hypothetical protein